MSEKKCPIIGQLENCVCHLHSLRNYGNKSKLDAVIESSNRKLANGCELDELRERVVWMLECEYVYRMRDFLGCGWAQIEIEYSFHTARKAVEELLCP